MISLRLRKSVARIAGSLRIQAWAAIAGTGILLIIVCALSFVVLSKSLFSTLYERALQAQARVAIESVVAAVELGGPQSLQAALSAFVKEEGHDNVAVYDGDGRLIASAVGIGESAFPQQLSALQKGVGMIDTAPIWREPIAAVSKGTATGVLVIRGSASGMREIWSAQLKYLSVFVMIASLGVLLMAWRVATRLTESIQRLTHWAVSMSAQTGRSIAPKVRGREVNELKHAFELLLDGLGQQHETTLELSHQLYKENEHLSAAVTRDPLTGLGNRRAVEQELARRIARGRDVSFAVVFIDLDRFKSINDQKGHLVGDVVLRECASRLRAVIREDDLAVRFAGDEFLIAVDGTWDEQQVALLRDRLAQGIRTPAANAQWREPIHASIGVSIFPVDGATVDALLAAADRSMYAAKRSLEHARPLPELGA